MKHLRNKIMLVLVVFSICVLLLNMLIVTWSFNRGFKRYIDQQRVEQIQALADELTNVYAQQSDWQWLLKQRNHWQFWLRTGYTQQVYENRFLKNDADKRKRLKQPDIKQRKKRLNDVQIGVSPHDEYFEGGGRLREKTLPHPDNFLPPFTDQKHPHRIGRLAKLTFIYDKNKTAIFGPRLLDENKISFVPVQSQGQTIAYLGYFSSKKIFSGIESVFFKQQRLIFLLSSLLALVISIFLSYLLAKRFLKPIVAIRKGLHSMVQGEYDQKVDIAGQDELAQLAKDVNALSDTLDKQDQIQQRWLADIAHELRTPLAVLKAQLEALEDGVRQFDKDELQLLIKESNYLQKLIEDLRELSLSEPGSFSYRWDQIDVIAFLKESQAIWSNHLQQFFIHLHMQIDVDSYFMQADSQRLQQLFHNLLQNSCRYTQASHTSPAVVKVTAYTNSNELHIIWEDSAPGVSEQKLEYLFDRLYRVDPSRNRHLAGSGLGLAICKNIVNAHGAKIEALASELGGLKIVMRFTC